MMWHLLQRILARKPARVRPPRPFSHRPAVELLEARLTPTPVDTVNFTETVFASSPSLGSATGLAWAPDASDRLFVLRKGGEVRIIENGTLLGTPFATITPIYTASEDGLIGMVFDRNFINNHFVYFFVSVSSTEQQIIRYTASGNIGTNKTVLIPGLPSVGANHVGGGIGIGLDNKLYFSIGDLGNGTGVDGDLTSLAAKVGRANLDGTVPADNPFHDGPGPNNDYIWARGFRNPFTMTFQESTGKLWVDVAGTLYEQAFQVNAADHAGWDDFENNQPAGFIPPRIKYRTNGTDAYPITSAVRSSNVATFTYTPTAGRVFRMGERITISFVTDPSFDGTFYIADTPSATTFTVAQVGPDASSSGGRAQTQNLGGAITGSTFYAGTQFAPPYQGNYFFADFNSGRVNRATLDAANNITSVDYFVFAVPGAVDVDTGPDGALYYIGFSSNTVYRLTFNTAVQNLVVSPKDLNLVEGGAGAVGVRLAVAPAGNVTVTAARTAGDSDISITAGATLTFTPTNWATPQYVFLAAAEDADTTNDTATISITSAGLPTQTVAAGAIDNDPPATPLPFILDNNQPGYTETGTWADWTGGYNNNFRYSEPVAANTATWTVGGLTPGSFTVQATWASDPSHAPNVVYRIYDGSSTIPLATVTVSQQTEPSGASFGGRPFQILAAVTLAGSTLRVEMDSTAGGYAIADAIRVAAPPATDLNWSGGGITGPTSATTTSTFAISRNYNISGEAVAPNFTIGYYRSSDAVFGNADDALLGTETISAPGDKTVGLHPGTSPALQILFPGAFYLFAKVDDGNAVPETNETNNVAQAPAQVTVTGPASPVVLDNGQPGYSEVGPWADWTGGFNDNFRWSEPVAGNRAVWTLSGLTSGAFNVQATWTSDPSHAQNVVYRIYDGNSTTPLLTISVNQRNEPVGEMVGGRPFQLLGSVTLASSTLRVEMDSDGSGYAIADAVRAIFVP